MRAAWKAPTDDVAKELRHVVAVLLADGTGSAGIQLVATRMGTSVRTLQRRLRARGLTYAAVAQEVRCAAALRMLEDPTRTIGEIARAVGYSDHPHFIRAFKAWTGLAPRDFRRRRAS